MTRPKSITTIDAGTGEALAVAGGAYRILVPGSATTGACSIIEMNVPPGGGPGPHAHKTVNESFYVLEGRSYSGLRRRPIVPVRETL